MQDNSNLGLQEFAINQLEQVKDFYLKDPSLMLEHYEHEKTTKLEYEGRELLELIQNADDAAKSAKEPKALIYLSSNNLIIANTGEPFTEGGLDSILHSNLSPKYNEKNQIGNKGLGFRSTLSWANKVTIISGDLRISFSKANSEHILGGLIKKNTAIEKQIVKRYGKKENAIAVFRCPDIVEDISIPEECKGFDTVIILDLKEQIVVDGISKNTVDVIEEQLKKSIDAEILLFLNHLDEIEIQTPGSTQKIKRELISAKTLSEELVLKRLKIGKGGLFSEWNIYSKVGTNKPQNSEEKSYELALAWQDELTHSKNVLHSYFRTDVTFKFPGILHGTFELSSNRNELIKGQGHNAFLFGEVAKLIAGAAQIIAESEIDQVNYKAMHYTMVDCQSLSNLVKESGFEVRLSEAIKSQNIFPTINNKYINWTDKPAYYKEEVFAANLSPERFHHLLLCCDNEDDEKFISLLGPFTYNIISIIDEVAKKRNDLPVDEYSKLIIAIHAYIKEDTLLVDKALFYNNNKELLTFNESIYLPNKSNKYNIPNGIGVQVIDTQLMERLAANSGVENSLGLLPKFIRFKIKEYKFTETVEVLIKHYITPASKQSDVLELNKILFQIYSIEENRGSKWLGTAVPLINKNKEIKKAAELYFGKEYGNSVVEEIYHFEKGKILAGPNKLQVEEFDLPEWKKYLEWLGVAHYPRKVVLNAVPKDYVLHCFKNYNFKNNIGSYKFRNHNDLMSRNPRYGDVRIQSIENLETILTNNSFETIIRWLHLDKQLLDKIVEDCEAPVSSIGIVIDADYTYRYMQPTSIKSYVKWIFSTSKWIETESGIKQAPGFCTTAANVNADFSPLIEKPIINYDNFLRLGINRDRIEYFLAEMGVHKNINTLSTKQLYGILLKLPEIDREGKKAKTIYNQLAATYEDRLVDKLDKTDSNYIEFHSKGHVFCKTGGYKPAASVYYVNDKRYSEAIIKHFNVIEIDKRRGKDKIKKIFGVNPLDLINLEIDDSPTLHKLNSSFEAEMERFKPFVYVLRKEVDSGSEKNVIKDTKFGLISELRLKLVKENYPEIIALNEYEYFYLKKKNIVYIKPPGNILEIQDLKDNTSFCMVIAEAFSAVLDVDSHRVLIHLLFSKPDSARDEVLSNELDDNTLQKLNTARQILGITNHPKLDFWKAFTKCMKGKKVGLKNSSDEELLNDLKLGLPATLYETVAEVFNEINYQEINEETSSELIVRLFNNAGITISKFNEFHYPSVNIKELYEISFRRALDTYKSSFKALYFEKCLINDTLKEGFNQALDNYNSIKPSFVNEVDFNVEADLKEKIQMQFDLNILQSSDTRDLDSRYKNNVGRLHEYLEIQEHEKNLVVQFIGEDILTQSLLYFEDKILAIAERFKTWMGKSKDNGKPNSSSNKSKRISFGSSIFLYDNLTDLKDQVDTVLAIEGLKNISSTIIRTSAKDVVKTENGKENPKQARKPKVPKEEVGFLGEYLVYRFLKETIDIKESVTWVSQYAKDCGMNLDGKDGLGYDIEYIPNGAKYKRYVEIKVVGWDDAFHISSAEVRFGEKCKGNYEIFLVRNMDTPTNAKIERIQGLFDYKGSKSFSNNDLFTVINDNYIIKFNKAK